MVARTQIEAPVRCGPDPASLAVERYELSLGSFVLPEPLHSPFFEDLETLNPFPIPATTNRRPSSSPRP
jgi:hypothetical protein